MQRPETTFPDIQPVRPVHPEAVEPVAPNDLNDLAVEAPVAAAVTASAPNLGFASRFALLSNSNLLRNRNRVLTGLAIGAGVLTSLGATLEVGAATAAEESHAASAGNPAAQISKNKYNNKRGDFDAYNGPTGFVTNKIRRSENQPVECKYTSQYAFNEDVASLVTAKCVYRASTKLHPSRKHKRSDPSFKKLFGKTRAKVKFGNSGVDDGQRFNYTQSSLEPISPVTVKIRPNHSKTVKFLAKMGCAPWPEIMNDSSKAFFGFDSKQDDYPCAPVTMTINPEVTFSRRMKKHGHRVKRFFEPVIHSYVLHRIKVIPAAPPAVEQPVRPIPTPEPIPQQPTEPTGPTGPTGSTGETGITGPTS